MPLIVVATPIGNLGDLSPRAEATLRSADFCIVEDTRVSGRLLHHLHVDAPMRVLNDHTPPERADRFADEIEAGATVALVSDAGAPGISDPGARLVDECHRRGVGVDCIPGPSAVTAALMLSGFFAQRFAFLGYLGRKTGDMRTELDPFAQSPYTLVLFESQHRIDRLMQVCFEAIGPRRYAVCREMTKKFQQVYRSKLPKFPSESEMPRKGEFTIVVEGRRKAPEPEGELQCAKIAAKGSSPGIIGKESIDDES